MSRCQACDVIMNRTLGFITLEDGTKIEESLCSNCRDISTSEYSLLDKEYAHEDSVILSVLFPDGMSRPKKVMD